MEIRKYAGFQIFILCFKAVPSNFAVSSGATVAFDSALVDRAVSRADEFSSTRRGKFSDR
jgi:hypothetical protein